MFRFGLQADGVNERERESGSHFERRLRGEKPMDKPKVDYLEEADLPKGDRKGEIKTKRGASRGEGEEEEERRGKERKERP